MEDYFNDLLTHASWAPLSGAQTIDLARKLRAETAAVGSALKEFRQDFQSHTQAMTALQDDTEKLQLSSRNVEDRLWNVDKRLDKMQSDRDRLDVRVSQVEQGVDKAKCDILTLFEQNEHDNTRIEQMRGEMLVVNDLLVKLQADLDRNFAADKSDRGLWEESEKKLYRKLNSIVNEVEELKVSRTELVSFDRKLGNDIERMTCHSINLEDRIKQISENMKTMGQQLADTADKSTKVEEDHNRLKASVNDTRGKTQSLATMSAALSDELKGTISKCNATQDKLDGTNAVLKSHHAKLQNAEQEVKRLSDEGRAVGQLLRSVQHGLEVTHNVAQSAKSGLAETNSLILPNIAMDNSNARAFMDAPLSTRSRNGGPGRGGILATQ